MVQRLAVCRAVLHDPDVLLLDEPRANLDPAAGDRLEPLIGRASGRTRVVTSHDPAGGLAEADVALGLRAGRQELLGAAAGVERRRGRARSTRTPRRRARHERADDARRRARRARQGAAARAARAADARRDDALLGDDLRRLPLRARPRHRRRPARRGRAVGDDAARRAARHRPPVRQRPRRGRPRGLPARAGRPHGAAVRQGRRRCCVFLLALQAVAVPLFAILLLGPTPSAGTLAAPGCS